jgi:hypothetical protein
MAWPREPPQAFNERDEVGISAMSRPAVLLDRHGVLVEQIYYSETGETEAPFNAEHVRLNPGATAVMRRLKEVLISNQAGFAKGQTSRRALWLAHKAVRSCA